MAICVEGKKLMVNKLEVISEVLEVDLTENDLSKLLSEIEEWDSISGLGLMAKADEEFNIVLVPDQLEAANTVQDLVNLLG